jgi:hypothetical protein
VFGPLGRNGFSVRTGHDHRDQAPPRSVVSPPHRARSEGGSVSARRASLRRRGIDLSSVKVLKAIMIGALVVVAALAGCGFGSGSSRAESAVRDAFQQTSDLGTLESVSCEESKTHKPPTEVEIALYDCRVTTSENGEVTWCLVDSPAGMAPFPLSCASALSEL